MHTQISIKAAVMGIWSLPLFVLGAQGRAVCRGRCGRGLTGEMPLGHRGSPDPSPPPPQPSGLPDGFSPGPRTPAQPAPHSHPL